MSTDLTVYDFEDQPVRIVTGADGTPWFVLADVCRVLELESPHKVAGRLDEDEKGRSSIPTPGGLQEITIINESGPYTLILRCRDAVTPGTINHSFHKLVTSHVLIVISRSRTYNNQGGDDLSLLLSKVMSDILSCQISHEKRLAVVEDFLITLGKPRVARERRPVVHVENQSNGSRLLEIIRAVGAAGISKKVLLRRNQFLDTRQHDQAIAGLVKDGLVGMTLRPTTTKAVTVPRVIDGAPP